MDSGKKKSAQVWFWVRVIGSVVFVGLLLRLVDFSELIDLLKHGEFVFYLAALGLFAINQLGFTWRWRSLLSALAIDVKIGYLLKVYLLGFAWNLVLPTNVGGDAVKIYRLIQDMPERKAEILAATLVDRIIGMFALLHWCLLGVWLASSWTLDARVALTLIFGGGLLLGYAAIVFNFLTPLTYLLERIHLSAKIGGFAQRVIEAFGVFHRALPVLGFALLLSLVSQLVYVINQYLLLRTIGLNVSLSYLLLVIPLVTLVSALPISLGGIGILEAGLTVLLGPVGVSATQVVSYSMLRYSIPILLGLTISVNNLFHVLRSSIQRIIHRN